MQKEFKVKKAKKKRDKSFSRELFELLAETAVFVFFVMTFVFQAFQIPTGSMEIRWSIMILFYRWRI
jgi:signal peptidase I